LQVITFFWPLGLPVPEPILQNEKARELEQPSLAILLSAAGQENLR
jgi:hypothetical protein